MCLPHPSLPLENCCAFTVQRADGRRCVIVFAAMNMSLWGADLKTWVTTDFEQSTNEILKILLILTLIFLSVPMLHAQQFEQGSGIGGCQAGSGVCNGWQWQRSQQQSSPQPSAPPVRWADRWGALVIGGETGKPAVFGVSSNMDSKSSAETWAINKCKALGGGDTCIVNMTYHNGCIALAEGEKFGATTTAGAELSETKTRAVRLCNEKYKNCDIVYSACSMPVRIQ